MRRVFLGALAAVLGGCGGGASDGREAGPGPRPPEITGRVIALDGAPIRGAEVITSAGITESGEAGRFRLPARVGTQWASVRHPRFLPRTRAAASGSPLLLRLTPDDGRTVSLQFGGDTMFGRRFYDRNEDGIPVDGLLEPGSSAREHSELLRGVKPLLAGADVTTVNLETPLTSRPSYSPLPPRPARFHPTKDFAFASARASAEGLRLAGVDVLDLGNNHLYDALEGGVAQTIGALGRAGFGAGAGRFGGGATEAEASRPAVRRSRGQSIAFVGCTTITGDEHPITYVAAGEKGGAARCEERELASRVAALRRRHDVVVAMIHGGFEYQRAPSARIRRLSKTARFAGATLVINHHPHVVGGFDLSDGSLTAWSLGNLIFDQTVWPTFQGYLLRVDVRDGQVVRAFTEPMMIEGYRPKAITGAVADLVAREAAGRERGPFVIEDGAMEVDVAGVARRHTKDVALLGARRSGTVHRLPRGASLERFSGPGRARLGRDLLWVGSFEDEDVAPGNSSGGLWAAGSRRFGPQAAFSGDVGARLARRDVDTSAALLTPRHRVLVEPGARLSLVGLLRHDSAARPKASLNLYRDTEGASSSQRRVQLGRTDSRGWRAFRLDITVPKDVVAAAPFIRLGAPAKGTARVDVDDMALIAWSGRDARPSALHDRLLVRGRGTATLRHDTLPGAEARIGRVTVLGEAP